MDLNYRGTLIAVAEDCPVTSSVVPTMRGGRKTLPLIQYEILKGHPYEKTSAEVLFESNMLHKGVSSAQLESRRTQLQEEFFSTPQPCLRASALPKKYGWGLHCNEEGRVALCAMESAEYQRFSQAPPGAMTVLKAFRSSRG